MYFEKIIAFMTWVPNKNGFLDVTLLTNNPLNVRTIFILKTIHFSKNVETRQIYFYLNGNH